MENDLHDQYGIDVHDPALMGARTWEWLKLRIAGLLDAPLAYTPDGRQIHTTRLGMHLFPPPPPKQE